MTPNSGSESNTYQMLWDCPHCRAPRLLGLTHRHCPQCGAPQDAKLRYFPSDAEKVKVEDHVYAGRDLVCRYCSAYNGRASKHCGECGSPLSEGADAQVRQAQVHAPGQFQGEVSADARAEQRGVVKAAPKPQKKRVWPWVVAGLAVLTLLVVVFSLDRQDSLVVAGHTWKQPV